MSAEPIGAAAQENALSAPLTLALLARALLLPFERPFRLLLLVILPVGPILVLIGQQADNQTWFDPPSGLVAWGAAALWVVSTGFSLCAWQRGVVYDFSEAILTWLIQGFQRSAACLLANFIWLAMPSLVSTFILFSVFGILMGFGVDLKGHFDEWPFILGFLVLTLPGFWLLGRFSSLPALVAAQGWSSAFARSLLATRKRDVTLTAAYLGISIAALFLSSLVWHLAIHFNATLVAPLDLDGSIKTILFRSVVLGAEFLLWSILLGWVTAFAALIARSAMPVKPIDPTTFD